MACRGVSRWLCGVALIVIPLILRQLIKQQLSDLSLSANCGLQALFIFRITGGDHIVQERFGFLIADKGISVVLFCSEAVKEHLSEPQMNRTRHKLCSFIIRRKKNISPAGEIFLFCTIIVQLFSAVMFIDRFFHSFISHHLSVDSPVIILLVYAVVIFSGVAPVVCDIFVSNILLFNVVDRSSLNSPFFLFVFCSDLSAFSVF